MSIKINDMFKKVNKKLGVDIDLPTPTKKGFSRPHYSLP